MAQIIFDKARMNGYRGDSGSEVLSKTTVEYDQFNEKFKQATVFDPHKDPRLLDCYKYLYGEEKHPNLDLEGMKELVNNSAVNASQVIYAARLYTIMYSYGGELKFDESEEYIKSIREKGDAILNENGDELSAVNLKRRYGYESGSIGGELAITIGAVQCLGLMRDQGLFGFDDRLFADGGKMDEGVDLAKMRVSNDDGFEEYKDMMRGAVAVAQPA